MDQTWNWIAEENQSELLQEALMYTDHTPITSFTGKYFFLSNFSPYMTFFEEKFYPTAEHAYQAAKTLDQSIRKQICNLETAKDAKRMGRSIVLRTNWEK